MAEVPEFVTVELVLGQFGSKRHKARAAYRQFVKEGLQSRASDELRARFTSEAKILLKSIPEPPFFQSLRNL